MNVHGPLTLLALWVSHVLLVVDLPCWTILLQVIFLTGIQQDALLSILCNVKLLFIDKLTLVGLCTQKAESHKIVAVWLAHCITYWTDKYYFLAVATRTHSSAPYTLLHHPISCPIQNGWPLNGHCINH